MPVLIDVWNKKTDIPSAREKSCQIARVLLQVAVYQPTDN